MGQREGVRNLAYNSTVMLVEDVVDDIVDCARRTSATRKQVCMRCCGLSVGICKRFGNGSVEGCWRTNGLRIRGGVMGVLGQVGERVRFDMREGGIGVANAGSGGGTFVEDIGAAELGVLGSRMSSKMESSPSRKSISLIDED